MKPQLTTESKQRFFYQYFGQPVFKVDMLSKLQDKPYPEILDDDYLKLKPLSSITDEDAIEVAIILGWDTHTKDQQLHYGTEFINDGEDCCSLDCYAKIVDFLRSKDYALPWMGLSVESMIEAGWIKLSEKGEGNG